VTAVVTSRAAVVLARWLVAGEL